MGKIKPQLVEKHLGLNKKQKNNSGPAKIREFHVQEIPLFGGVHQSSNVRTLKAVYAHFANAKRKAMAAADGRGAPPSQESLSGDDLRVAMENAKSSFQEMKKVQEELNQAYKELMTQRP